MPKNYQEIERIVEEFTDNYDSEGKDGGIVFSTGFNGILIEEWLKDILTTYGNARELQGVEKVEDQYASDIKVLKESHEIMLDAISCMTLEAFMIWSEHRKTKVKSELK